MSREERQLSALWGVAAVSAVVLRPFWLAVAPHLRSCTFRSLTGVPCPTCGTTRTAVALLELDPVRALHTNPLAAAVGIALVVGGMLALVWAVFSWPLPRPGLGWNRRWTALLLALITANWIYLMLTL